MRALYAAFLLMIPAIPASASSYCVDALSCYVGGQGPFTLKDLEDAAQRAWTEKLAACARMERLSCWCKLELAREGPAGGPLFVTVGDVESAKTLFFAHRFTSGKSSVQFIWINDCPPDTVLAFEAKLAYLRMPPPPQERFRFGTATKF
jgi:hypothetical protein